MELLFNENWQNFTVSIYLRNTDNGRRVIYGQKDGQLVEQVLTSDLTIQPIEPLLKMPTSLANEFLIAVSNYLSNKNIKTENENLLQGKLSATERHLEDMRVSFTKVLDKVLS